MNWKRLSRISQILGSGLGAGLLFWLVWAGAQGLVGVIQNGRIVNRRGPNVYMSDNPIIFWALSGFFALGVILMTGLALICLLHWFSLFRRSNR
ncbi:hypothetical protein EGJ57_21185 [Brucella anthropi]|nr:hypothetical protein EGJ57_21185 [Brucella anthropi]